MLKSVIMPMTETCGRGALADFAVAVSRAYSLHLSVEFIRPDPRAAIPLLGEGLPAATIQDLCDAADREGVAAAQAVESELRAQTSDSPLTFTIRTGLISDHAGRRARLADLALCQPPTDGDADDIFEDLLFRSGKPLLMVPEGAKPPPFATVLIAWNGRSEGARAMSQAIPFLSAAKHVILLQVGDLPADRPSLEDAAGYLQHYGLAPTVERRTHDGRSIAQTLLQSAEALGADLLVMGAYSHARWREMIVGGVTRDIIHQAGLPVFLSH